METLPTLTGTDKQVAYATTLREQAVAAITSWRTYIDNLDRDDDIKLICHLWFDARLVAYQTLTAAGDVIDTAKQVGPYPYDPSRSSGAAWTDWMKHARLIAGKEGDASAIGKIILSGWFGPAGRRNPTAYSDALVRIATAFDARS